VTVLADRVFLGLFRAWSGAFSSSVFLNVRALRPAPRVRERVAQRNVCRSADSPWGRIGRWRTLFFEPLVRSGHTRRRTCRPLADESDRRVRVASTALPWANRPAYGGKLLGVEPSGNRFEVRHIHWYKVRDGAIVDHYAARPGNDGAARRLTDATRLGKRSGKIPPPLWTRGVSTDGSRVRRVAWLCSSSLSRSLPRQ
jgi:hypothetical protein